MFGRLVSLHPILAVAKRSLYMDVRPHSKLLIRSVSPLEVTCLPACEADRNSVIIPDSGNFRIIEGCQIRQEFDTKFPITQPNIIQVPAKRGMDVVKSKTSAQNLAYSKTVFTPYHSLITRDSKPR